VLITRSRLHRQQKKNYVKFLEQDVIRLREMISVVESETAIFHQENAAMKTTLSENGVQTGPGPLPALDFQTLTAGISSAEGHNLQESVQASESQPLYQSPPWAAQSTTPSSTTISVGYDERISAKRLHVSSPSDSGSQDLHSAHRTPPAINFDAILELRDPASFFADPPPQFANLGALETMPKQLDTSFEGINFILA
jgi:hypothetical protein